MLEWLEQLEQLEQAEINSLNWQYESWVRARHFEDWHTHVTQAWMKVVQRYPRNNCSTHSRFSTHPILRAFF